MAPTRRPYRHICTEGLVVYHLFVTPPAADAYSYVQIVGARRLGIVQCSSTEIISWPAGLSEGMRQHVEDALAAAWRLWSS